MGKRRKKEHKRFQMFGAVFIVEGVKYRTRGGFRCKIKNHGGRGGGTKKDEVLRGPTLPGQGSRESLVKQFHTWVKGGLRKQWGFGPFLSFKGDERRS